MQDSVLVTDGGNGGARSTLAAVRALAAANYRALVSVSGQLSLAASSNSCYSSIATPPADDPSYAQCIRDAASRYGAACILAASDAALIALGAPVSELISKAALAELATRVGIPTPETERICNTEELLVRAEEFPYPIVVKSESSGPPAIRIRSPGELRSIRLVGPVVVQPYLDGRMEAVAGFVRDGELVAVVHQDYIRTWPVSCGTSCCAITVPGSARREKELVELLAGYDGIFQAQFRDGHLLDINPRVYGSLPLAVGAGVNLAALQADYLLGKDLPKEVVRGRTGVRYRWLDGDLRHSASLIANGHIMSGLAALVPHAGTVHSIWSCRDPLPALARARMMLRKVR